MSIIDNASTHAVFDELNAKHQGQYTVQTTADGIPTIWVGTEHVLDVLLTLRTLPKPYVMLVDLSAIDERLRTHRHGLPASDFTVFYHLMSLERNSDIRVKVALKEGQSTQSATKIYPNANPNRWDTIGGGLYRVLTLCKSIIALQRNAKRLSQI